MKKRPNVLLINPWVYDFAAFDLFLKPLGLLYLSSHLKKTGIKVHFLDCMDRYDTYFIQKNCIMDKKSGTGKFYSEQIEKPGPLKFVPRHYKRYGLPFDEVYRRLKEIGREKISAVCITGIMTYWYRGVRDMIKLVKSVLKDVPVILGGIYPTIMTHHARNTSGADLVIPGYNMKNILENISKIIHFLPENESVSGEYFTEWGDPDYSLYKKLSYLVLLTSMGCPFKCTYCSTPLLHPEFSFKPPESSFRLIEKFKIRDIAFYDDALLYRFQENLQPLLLKVIRSKNKYHFHAPNGLHIKFINKDVAPLLYKSRFKTLYLSFETSDPVRQKISGNKTTTDEFIQAVKSLKKAGFKTDDIKVYLLVGFPDQKKQEVLDSIKMVRDSGASPKVVEYAPIPGSRDYKKYFSDRLIDPLLHNNSIFYAKYSPFTWDDMHYFRQKAKESL
ncbi:MAG: radical SAM protein [Spirochaetes bacterium]|nr:radical SAM protein [Spirochaetota bacterium]